MMKKAIRNVLQSLRKKSVPRASGNDCQPKTLGEDGEFKYYIEEFSYYNKVLFITGWVFSTKQKIEKIGFINSSGEYQYLEYETLDSRDVAGVYGSVAQNARFSVRITHGLPEDLLNVSLVFATSDNSCVATELWEFGVIKGPLGTFLPDFFSRIAADDKRTRVLEIGSRARSGISNKDRFISPEMEYVGVDIKKGQDVDIVCDAHTLSRYVENDSFDCVYSLNTFEHLLMPWKVALEINKVLKPDGLVMIFTHHAFPLHDVPWDFWRFSDNAWHGIFNQYSGFEIVETGLGDPVSIVPKSMYAGTLATKDAPAYIHSMVVARKIGLAELSWDVEVSEVLQTVYPE